MKKGQYEVCAFLIAQKNCLIDLVLLDTREVTTTALGGRTVPYDSHKGSLQRRRQPSMTEKTNQRSSMHMHRAFVWYLKYQCENQKARHHRRRPRGGQLQHAHAYMSRHRHVPLQPTCSLVGQKILSTKLDRTISY